MSNSFQLCPTDFFRWAKSFAEKALKSVENERSFVAVVTGNFANKCNSVWMFEKKTQLEYLYKV